MFKEVLIIPGQLLFSSRTPSQITCRAPDIPSYDVEYFPTLIDSQVSVLLRNHSFEFLILLIVGLKMFWRLFQSMTSLFQQGQAVCISFSLVSGIPAMASSSTSDQVQSEDLTQMRCTYCFQELCEMTDPRLLPCQHIVCLSCLQEDWKQNALECRACR